MPGSLLLALLCLAEPSLAACLSPPVCALDDALKETERAPPAKRLAPALRGLSRCLGPLERDAREGASEPREARARRLAAHAPATCKLGSPLAPALEIASRCPMPQIVEPDSLALRDLDAGTYAFLVAARARLEREGALGPAATRLLLNAVMGGALERGR